MTDISDDPSTGIPNDPTITRLTIVTPQSSMEVTKTATISDNGNGTTGLGDTITFLITVENTGNIGKSYRKHDEIGTPICITVDYDTIEKNKVTFRDRDTMEQEVIDLKDIEASILKLFKG